MSFVKAAKWFAFYVILTLGFAAIAASGTFIVVSDRWDGLEFGTLFFFFLFATGISVIFLGILIVFRTPRLVFNGERWSPERRYRDIAVTAGRKEGILLILVGLTLFLVWLTRYLLVGGS
jgi:hypothetical protein